MKLVDPSSLVSWFCYFAGLSYEYRETVSPSFALGTAILIMMAAIGAFLLAVVALQKYMGFAASTRSFGEPSRLVTTGPFRFTRNPIYLAFLLPISALAFISLSTAVCTIGVYITAMNLIIIRREEKVLRETFGSDYQAYCARTPRWLFI